MHYESVHEVMIIETGTANKVANVADYQMRKAELDKRIELRR
jgi:hypothetical protein